MPARMKRIDLKKRNDQWVAESGGDTIASARTKADAVKKTAAAARKREEPVTVRIHGVNGRILEERTYPRGADPRHSRG